GQLITIALFRFFPNNDVDLSADVYSLRNLVCQVTTVASMFTVKKKMRPNVNNQQTIFMRNNQNLFASLDAQHRKKLQRNSTVVGYNKYKLMTNKYVSLKKDPAKRFDDNNVQGTPQEIDVPRGRRCDEAHVKGSVYYSLLIDLEFDGYRVPVTL
nr:hypothetical protein [Tanacetum cinerariifolium]